MRIQLALFAAALISGVGSAQPAPNYLTPPASQVAPSTMPRSLLSPEERAQRRAAVQARLAAMTPEQRKRHEQRRAEIMAMTPEQRAAFRQQQAASRAARQQALPPR